MGMRNAAITTTDIIDSGGGWPGNMLDLWKRGGDLPVLGSGLWALIMRFMGEAEQMVIMLPTPMPRKASEDWEMVQPRISV